MLNYSQELQRRIGQFTGYLKKMYHRAHEDVHGSCFIICEERPPTNGSDRLLKQAKCDEEYVKHGGILKAHCRQASASTLRASPVYHGQPARTVYSFVNPLRISDARPRWRRLPGGIPTKVKLTGGLHCCKVEARCATACDGNAGSVRRRLCL